MTEKRQSAVVGKMEAKRRIGEVDGRRATPSVPVRKTSSARPEDVFCPGATRVACTPTTRRKTTDLKDRAPSTMGTPPPCTLCLRVSIGVTVSSSESSWKRAVGDEGMEASPMSEGGDRVIAGDPNPRTPTKNTPKKYPQNNNNHAPPGSSGQASRRRERCGGDSTVTCTASRS